LSAHRRRRESRNRRYGIAKSVFEPVPVWKRRAGAAGQAPQAAAAPETRAPPPKAWEKKLSEGAGHMQLLEANGFLVVANQAEAAAISAELEESIRRGLVVGTRAFNKKYYITLKSFVSKNSSKVVKSIGPRGTSVSDISRATGIDDEGVRAILYMLAENGDVSEARRDFFKLV